MLDHAHAVRKGELDRDDSEPFDLCVGWNDSVTVAIATWPDEQAEKRWLLKLSHCKQLIYPPLWDSWSR